MIRRTVLPAGFICCAAAIFAAFGWARGAPGEDLATTNTSRAAFSQPFAFIGGGLLEDFRAGAAIFRQPWLVAPAADETRFDGLGPLYNRLSCVGCHIGNGRGETSANENDVLRSTLVRLSVPGAGPHGEPVPEPVYGDQLQSSGIAGVPAEADGSIRWHERDEVLPDGTHVSLRSPELLLKNFHYGPLAPGTMTSVRRAPGLFGLGLLASVPGTELTALAAIEQNNHDGVHGRVNQVWDAEAGRMAVGRFGLKANEPSLRQQIAAALQGDMGISSRLFMGQNCTDVETACKKAPSGGSPEISDRDLALLVSYVAALAPPARRTGGAEADSGKQLFDRIGCAACHAASLTTGPDARFPQIAGRAIHPYTDMLLHDMGDGLADGRPDYRASGRDWRTAPLWGIGLAAAVNPDPTYLHDGRARDLTEAILWHGGEAASARDAFAALAKPDRDAVIAFLNSL